MTRPTDAQQRTARIAGVWFAITFVASIPALFLYKPLLKHHNYILGSGVDTRIGVGAALEIILVIANIACAVGLYPISQAPKPEHQPRLRRESHDRISDHRRRHHQRPGRRNPAPGRRRSGRSRWRLTRPR